MTTHMSPTMCFLRFILYALLVVFFFWDKWIVVNLLSFSLENHYSFYFFKLRFSYYTFEYLSMLSKMYLGYQLANDALWIASNLTGEPFNWRIDKGLEGFCDQVAKSSFGVLISILSFVLALCFHEGTSDRFLNYFTPLLVIFAALSCYFNRFAGILAFISLWFHDSDFDCFTPLSLFFAILTCYFAFQAPVHYVKEFWDSSTFRVPFLG